MKKLEWMFKLVDRISGPASRIRRALGGVWSALTTIGPAAGRGLMAAGRAAAWMGGQVQAAGRMALMLGAGAVGGVALLGRAVTRAGGEAETAQISIAGMMRAAGGTRDWATAMDYARRGMEMVRQGAAALPGTEADFLTIFRQMMPAALDSNLRGLEDIVGLSNQIGAIGIASGIDAEQIGRDLEVMLRGRAGAQVRTWTVLGPNIRRVAESLHLSARNAEEFNRLRPEQRVQLLQQAAGRYREMIAASANTWDAISSTTRSNAMGLFRIATSSLFGRMRDTLGRLNGSFDRNHASAEAMARSVGQQLGDAFDFVVTRAQRLWSWMQRIAHSPIAARVRAQLGNAEGRQRIGVAAAGVAGLAMGIPGLGILAAGFAALSRRGVTFSDVLGRLQTIGAAIAGVLVRLYDVVGSIVAVVLPPLSRAFERIAPILSGFLDRVGPRLVPIFERIAEIFERVAPPIFNLLVGVIENLVIPALDDLVGFIESLPGMAHDERRVRQQLNQRQANGDTLLSRTQIRNYQGMAGVRAVEETTRLANGATQVVRRILGTGGNVPRGELGTETSTTGRIGVAPGLAGVAPAPALAGTVAAAGRPNVSTTVRVNVDATGQPDAQGVGQQTAQQTSQAISNTLADLGVQHGGVPQ